MKDPTKPVRKMFVAAFNGLCEVYDGFAPADAATIYAVIRATSWNRTPIKNCNTGTFTTTIEIYEEFAEYGNSEGVDTIADTVMEILLPLDSDSYLAIDGYSTSEITIDAISNDTGVNDAMAIWRKTIILNHIITEN